MSTSAGAPGVTSGSGPAIGEPGRPLGMPGGALACWTSRAHGDLGPLASGPLAARRRAVLDRTWGWVTQVHGAAVVMVGDPAPEGPPADALVAASAPGPLAVFTADCAPIALASPEGVIGAVHAGWKGLAAGVVAAAVEVMGRAGAGSVSAALGPCIHPECYEFSAPDLGRLVDRFGPSAQGSTATGAPALDLPGAVRTAVAEAGAELVFDSGVCTACSDRHWSYRCSGDRERQALLVWRP